MAKGILVVQTAAADGREQEFHDWYNDVHLVDILKIAGFTSARRFTQVSGESGTPHLAIYEIEADDLKSAEAGIGAAMAAGDIRMSDVLAMDPPPSMVLYEQVAELQA